jgi:hypothetical protein
MVRVGIAEPLFMQWLTHGTEKVLVCEGGLPEGSRIVDVIYHRYARVVWLIVMHESFEPIENSTPTYMIPERAVLYKAAKTCFDPSAN